MSKLANFEKKLVLHVGHGATGSSYIQSSLALTKEDLRDVGVDYPDHPSLKDARNGFITSGNLSHERWLEEIETAASRSSSPSLLFSNEHLFWSVLRQRTAIPDLKERFDLKIILFIKNPLSHMTSRYVQSVKRGGNTGTIEAHASTYDVPYRVIEFLEMLRENEVAFQVINYSNSRLDLLGKFYQSCDVKGVVFKRPPLPKVNRSLTLAELEMQRLFNLHYGPASQAFISDVLCNDLPAIDVRQRPRLDDAAYREFNDRMRPAIQQANTIIPEPERYEMEPNSLPSTNLERGYSFTREQLDVLVRSISGILSRSD
jgi:hypothetical protein